MTRDPSRSDVLVLEIPARREVGAKFILVSAASGYFGMVLGFFMDGPFPTDPVLWAWLAALGVSLVALLFVLARFWRPVGLRFDGERMTQVGRFREKSIPASEIQRLAVIDLGLKYRALLVEGVGERQVTLTFRAKAPPAGLEAFLEGVAMRTGQAWRGVDTPSAASGKASWRELVRAWRDAAELRTKRQVVLWIVGHAFWPRMDRLGVNDAFLHRGTQLFVYGLMIAWLPLFVVEVGIIREWEMGFVLLPIFGSVLAAWIVACLGMNFVLFFTRGESRVRETMEADLRAARDVQRRLLPASAPDLPGLDVAGSCDPAREVGGDYFDYLVASRRTGSSPWSPTWRVRGCRRRCWRRT